jgi:hypothetical protein
MKACARQNKVRSDGFSELLLPLAGHGRSSPGGSAAGRRLLEFGTHRAVTTRI